MSQFNLLRTRSVLVPVILSLFTIGCASTYKPLPVTNIVYLDTKPVNDSLKVSYRYGVQYLGNNKRYGNREMKHNLAAVAMKIENTSTVPLVLTRSNFKVSSATGDKVVVSPITYGKKVKQRVGTHMLHTLWGPWGISWSEDEYGNRETKGYYIPAGLIVGIANAVRASNANKKQIATLTQYEIWNKEIPAGGSLTGIITISTVAREEALNFSYNGGTTPQLISSGATDYKPSYPTKSSEFNFYVWPLEGYAFDARSKIYVTDGPHYVLAKGKKVFPQDTKSLSRVTASGRQLLGLPHGDKWLFNVLPGKINGYFFLAEDDLKAVSHIQKGDGPLIDFTPDALLQMVDGDPDAIDLIVRKKYYDAIVFYNSKK